MSRQGDGLARVGAGCDLVHAAKLTVSPAGPTARPVQATRLRNPRGLKVMKNLCIDSSMTN
jgi:hypothetical protein